MKTKKEKSEYQKEWRRLNKERFAFLRRKYGKLPRGFEYHHIGPIYNCDKFIILDKRTHELIHKCKEM
jgi:hypothetical protein